MFVQVRLSPDLWSGLSRKQDELSLVTYVFHCNTTFFLHSPLFLSFTHTLHAHSWFARVAIHKMVAHGKARRPPLLGTRHPWCQECQLREWRDEGKGGGKCDWCRGQGKRKRCGGKRDERDKKETRRKERERGKKRLHWPEPSVQFIPPQRRGRKELIGLRDRMQGRGLEEEKEGVLQKC